MLLIFLLCLISSLIYQAAAANNGDLEEKYLMQRAVWRLPEFSCSRNSPHDATSSSFESFGSTWYIVFFHEWERDPVLINVVRRRDWIKPYEDIYVSLHLKKTDGTETTLIQNQIYPTDVDGLTANTSMKCSEFKSPAYRNAPVLRKNMTVTLNLWTKEWEKDKSASCFKTPAEATCDASKSRDSGLESTSTLLKNLEDLLTTGDDHDVVFNVRFREFKAHKNILRARSPVFAEMFRRAEKDRSIGSISIADYEPETFGDFLRYVYTGKLEDHTPARVMSLYYLADKYKIPSLRKMSVDTLKTSLSITVVTDVISFATKHNETDLLLSAETFFSKHMEEITVT